MIRKNVDILAIAVLLVGLVIYDHVHELIRAGKAPVERVMVAENVCRFWVSLFRSSVHATSSPVLPSL